MIFNDGKVTCHPRSRGQVRPKNTCGIMVAPLTWQSNEGILPGFCTGQIIRKVEVHDPCETGGTNFVLRPYMRTMLPYKPTHRHGGMPMKAKTHVKAGDTITGDFGNDGRDLR